MTLGLYLRRALTLPPHVVLSRAAHILGGYARSRARKARGLLRPSYARDDEVDGLSLERYYKPLPIEALLPYGDLIATRAGQILRHEFDLLGSGLVVVNHPAICRGLEGHLYQDSDPIPRGQTRRINRANAARADAIRQDLGPGYVPIDWSRDFISGYRWAEDVWAADIQYGVLPGVDVKVPWELARMQHLPWLSWAFALSSAGRLPGLSPDALVRELENEILDFQATNPPRFGVNWKCTMDVAIRAANWLVAVDLARAYGAPFRPEFDRAMRRGILEHGRHIFDNLEWGLVVRANHYLADLAGLIFVASYLTGTPESEDWLRFGLAEFIREVTLQFYADGGNFEASTSYHRLSAEMVGHVTALVLALPLSRLRGLAARPVREPRGRPATTPPLILRDLEPGGVHPFPDEYLQRLAGMRAFTQALTIGPGRVPQFGDNDSGRFLKVFPCPPRGEATAEGWLEDVLDHRPLLDLLAPLAATTANRDQGLDGTLVAALVGPSRAEAFRSTATRAASVLAYPTPVASFPSAGLVVFRHPPVYLAVRCGPVGQNGNGGHAHNDQLSLEVWVDELPVVVDPGTYVYTPLQAERCRFRSTASHNVVMIEGREQNPWPEGRAGLFTMQDRARGQILEVSETTFVATHQGFGVVHRRALRVGPGSLEGLDECPVPTAELVFHFHPDVVVELDGKVLSLVSGRRRLSLSSSGEAWSLSEAWHSPAYGVRRRCMRCSAVFREGRIEWAFTLADPPTQ